MKRPELGVTYLGIRRLKTGVPDDQTPRTWDGWYEILKGYSRKISERRGGNIKPPCVFTVETDPEGRASACENHLAA